GTVTELDATTLREQRKIREVAREYRRAGYQVFVEPGGPLVPDFLGDYRPDVIAIGDQESVVIEVKSVRGFDRSDVTHDVALRVSKQPGWRFELVITNPRRGSLTNEQNPWDLLVVDNHLKQVRDLSESGQLHAAFLLLWADAEALLRHLARQEGILVNRLSPPQIVKELATQGVLDRRDYSPLEEAAAVRNALAHGVGPSAVDPQLLKKLLAVTEGLREEVQSAA
ncbi:MAG: hypothetical protein HW416_2817, partial [Chloroflexi bacterium]|nr:hypothetical protein [Chloroflexota bacterium]